jgi:hypothetical protein
MTDTDTDTDTDEFCGICQQYQPGEGFRKIGGQPYCGECTRRKREEENETARKKRSAAKSRQRAAKVKEIAKHIANRNSADALLTAIIGAWLEPGETDQAAARKFAKELGEFWRDLREMLHEIPTTAERKHDRRISAHDWRRWVACWRLTLETTTTAELESVHRWIGEQDREREAAEARTVSETVDEWLSNGDGRLELITALRAKVRTGALTLDEIDPPPFDASEG